MSKPIAKIKSGFVECAVWQGDYKGKPTYSYSFQKCYRKGDSWENTNYMNMNDLYDLQNIVGEILKSKIKKNKNEQKQEYKQPEAQDDFEDDDIPF